VKATELDVDDTVNYPQLDTYTAAEECSTGRRRLLTRRYEGCSGRSVSGAVAAYKNGEMMHAKDANIEDAAKETRCDSFNPCPVKSEIISEAR
jgi:hypothetical protein